MPHLHPSAIVESVASAAGITKREILSGRRSRDLTIARAAVVIMLCSRGMSYRGAGRQVGIHAASAKYLYWRYSSDPLVRSIVRAARQPRETMQIDPRDDPVTPSAAIASLRHELIQAASILQKTLGTIHDILAAIDGQG